MRGRLRWLLIALVVMPVALAAGAAVLLDRSDRALWERRLEDQLDARLAEYARLVAGLVDARRLELSEALTVSTVAELKSLAAAHPWVSGSFAMAPSGELELPQPAASLSPAERDFLRRTQTLWQRSDALIGPEAATSAGEAYWHSWYWEQGLQLMLWRREPSGRVVGAELNIARFMADVVAALPRAGVGAGPTERFRLVDARGRVLHQWGARPARMDEAPRRSLALGAPLGAWRLEAFVAPVAGGARHGFGTLVALAALMFAVVAVAVLFHRESTRSLREAGARVSFVSRVSHELRTPLTNIRLHAELLERELEEDAPARSKLEVITAESQRLSRLIANVLSFAREQRGPLTLHPRTLVVDALVREVADQFAPALARRGMSLALDLDAASSIRGDADAIAQILANLLGNAEKYATPGARVSVTSRQQERVVTLVVQDQGPGIPSGFEERIFEPFFRLDDRLSSSATGTGIGLGISRELARLHGGELRCVPFTGGACFELTLPREEGV